MKNTAVVFFTADNGDQLQADINTFFKKYAFTLMNVCYGCYYEASKRKAVHNAMVTYEYVAPVKNIVPGVEIDTLSILQ